MDKINNLCLVLLLTSVFAVAAYLFGLRSVEHLATQNMAIYAVRELLQRIFAAIKYDRAERAV